MCVWVCLCVCGCVCVCMCVCVCVCICVVYVCMCVCVCMYVVVSVCVYVRGRWPLVLAALPSVLGLDGVREAHGWAGITYPTFSCGFVRGWFVLADLSKQCRRNGRFYRFASSHPPRLLVVPPGAPFETVSVSSRSVGFSRARRAVCLVCCVSGPSVDVPRRLPSLSLASGLIPLPATLKSVFPFPI